MVRPTASAQTFGLEVGQALQAFSAGGDVGLPEGKVGREVLRVEREWNGRNTSMGVGNLGDSLSNLDLGQLTQYLPNLDFPASKDEVVSEVQNNNAPQEVVDQIKNSSNDTFNNADEVLETVRGNR
jgi:hypothetical protein